MANFSVTTTDILGTDSMSNSRVTINNNFRSLAETINNIGNYFTGSDQFGTSTLNVTALSVTSASVTTNQLKIGNTTLVQTQLDKLLAIPVPTTADNGKILKVNASGNYELVTQ